MEYNTSSRLGLIVTLVNQLSALGVTMILPPTDTIKRRIVLEDDPEGDFRAAATRNNNGSVLRSGILGGDLYAILSLSAEDDLTYRAKWGLDDCAKEGDHDL